MAGIMIVKQRVADVARWKSVFSNPELESIRQQHGLYVVGASLAAGEPTTVIVVMEMKDLTRAKEFAQSGTLAEARTKAGAVGAPEGIWYGESSVSRAKQRQGRSSYMKIPAPQAQCKPL